MSTARTQLVAMGLGLALALPGFTAKAAARAEPAEPKTLRMAVKPITPFVIKQGTEWSGFSIDLWNTLAQSLGVETTWVEVATVNDQLQAVKDGRADAAIAAITITREREEVVDFSQPYFDSGLQILVRARGGNLAVDLLDSIPWPTLGALLGVFAAIMFVMANVLWLVERRSSKHFDRGYFRGIGEGLWGAALIIATGEHGDRHGEKIVKRLIVFFMWLVGVVLIAQLTATISSTQTVDRLHSTIRGPSDLPGRTVATVAGTFAADYLTEHRLDFVKVASVEEGAALVAAGKVQAMVFDAPTLQYVTATRGNGALMVVGPIFAPEKYGIAVGYGSPLRKRINKALLQMYEDGRYRTLYEKWFSAS